MARVALLELKLAAEKERAARIKNAKSTIYPDPEEFTKWQKNLVLDNPLPNAYFKIVSKETAKKTVEKIDTLRKVCDLDSLTVSVVPHNPPDVYLIALVYYNRVDWTNKAEEELGLLWPELIYNTVGAEGFISDEENDSDKDFIDDEAEESFEPPRVNKRPKKKKNEMTLISPPDSPVV